MSDYDPLDQEANDQADTDRKEGEKLGQDQLIADFKWLMAGPKGRRVVWNLLERAGVFRSTFVPGDPLAGAFAEGQRNIGCYLLDLIHSDNIDQYVLMLKEHKDNA